MAAYYNSKRKICNLICTVIILLSPNFAYAQKLESTHHDWSVLTTTIDSNKVCYMASIPTAQEGNFENRQDTYILVNQFPERKPEISFIPGFALQTEKNIKIDIDSDEYFLNKIKDNIAWTRTIIEDEDLIAAMKKGIELNIHSQGQKNEYAIDTYSLKGFTAALNKLETLCAKEES